MFVDARFVPLSDTGEMFVAENVGSGRDTSGGCARGVSAGGGVTGSESAGGAEGVTGATGAEGAPSCVPNARRRASRKLLLSLVVPEGAGAGAGVCATTGADAVRAKVEASAQKRFVSRMSRED